MSAASAAAAVDGRSGTGGAAAQDNTFAKEHRGESNILPEEKNLHEIHVLSKECILPEEKSLYEHPCVLPEKSCVLDFSKTQDKSLLHKSEGFVGSADVGGGDGGIVADGGGGGGDEGKVDGGGAGKGRDGQEVGKGGGGGLKRSLTRAKPRREDSRCVHLNVITTCVYICTNTCIQICVYIYTHVCTYIHAHTCRHRR